MNATQPQQQPHPHDQFDALPASISVHDAHEQTTICINQQIVLQNNIINNPNGIILNLKNFSTLLWHLNALESKLSQGELNKFDHVIKNLTCGPLDASQALESPFIPPNTPAPRKRAKKTRAPKNDANDDNISPPPPTMCRQDDEVGVNLDAPQNIMT